MIVPLYLNPNSVFSDKSFLSNDNLLKIDLGWTFKGLLLSLNLMQIFLNFASLFLAWTSPEKSQGNLKRVGAPASL